MATQSEIIAAIEQRVTTSKTVQYSIWTIGITADPKQRRDQHESDGKNTAHWMHWKADSETIARNVEKYFLSKGMKGDVGGGIYPTYVYIF